MGAGSPWSRVEREGETGQTARYRVILITIALTTTGMVATFLAPTSVSGSTESGSGERVSQENVEMNLTPKSWEQMKNSHNRWQSTGDLWRKVDPDDRATYNRTRDLGDFSPKYAEVWTVGQPTSHTTEDPQGRQTVTIEGRRLESSETSQLRSIATVVNVSVTYPSATVKVTTFDQIERILKQPFVYLLEFPHDGYQTMVTYDAN